MPAAGFAPAEDSLARWVAAASASLDACLVLDAAGRVAGLSPSAADLLGQVEPQTVGRALDEVLSLIDFTDGSSAATGMERRIPPLIAVSQNALARGVMRLVRPDGARLMLDAIAAPIHDADRSRPVGSVSFLVAV